RSLIELISDYMCYVRAIVMWPRARDGANWAGRREARGHITDRFSRGSLLCPMGRDEIVTLDHYYAVRHILRTEAGRRVGGGSAVSALSCPGNPAEHCGDDAIASRSVNREGTSSRRTDPGRDCAADHAARAVQAGLH